MAKRCPNCEYTAESDWDDACPICGRPLQADGKPDPWYNRRMRVQKVVQVILIVTATAVVLGVSFRVWQNLR